MKIRFIFRFCLSLLLTLSIGKAQDLRVDPPNWWVGMKNSRVELMVHGNDIAASKAKFKQKGLEILMSTPGESPNYLFLEVDTRNASPGTYTLELKSSGQSKKYDFEMRERKPERRKLMGVHPTDMIYLIFPDRFANGDPSNDVVKGMNQTSLDRNDPLQRHGGDLKGIIDHLDYVQDLGATALWLNPVLESDQPEESYHGYAITDHYKVDPRFGDNTLYLKLIDECHQRGMKVIMDVVLNHTGNEHYFVKDQPFKDWLHQWEEFTRTTYRAPTLLDPYASGHDKKQMSDGWFDHHMPDLNQQNTHLANYLIQNHIWWIETAGFDGFRIDTYAYADQDFMRAWAKMIKYEYPELTMFGETWVHGVPVQAWFDQQNPFIEGLTDFQLYYAINHCLHNNFGWTEGMARLYYTLAKDYVYKKPFYNVTFLDNHDLTRYYTSMGKDLNKFKMGISLLLTTRGTPMLFYGTELLMDESANPDAKVRIDFPGGWKGDPLDKFTAEGRTAEENEAFQHIRTLARYRRETPALQTGKMTQFVPTENVYVYFRWDEAKTVMVILNATDEEKQLDTGIYTERMEGFSSAKDVLSGESLSDLGKIKLKARSSRVLELGE